MDPGKSSDWIVKVARATSNFQGPASSVIFDEEVLKVCFSTHEPELPENVSIWWKRAHMVSVDMKKSSENCTGEAVVEFKEGTITFAMAALDFCKVQEGYFDPKNKHTLRGVNAEVVIGEEAAYMDLRVFHEVVVPLLTMQHAVLIMISTPVDSFNFYSKLLGIKKPNGDPLFLTYEAELVCPRCAQKKEEEAVKCRHMLRLLPRWKSTDKMEVVNLILKDQVTTLLREQMGMITNDGGSFFGKDEVADLIEGPQWEPDRHSYPRYVLITCDPNVKRSQYGSEMALVAGTLEGGLYTICGMDAYKANTAPEAIGLLDNFIKKLRAHPALSRSWIFFCCERNTGQTSSYLAQRLIPYQRHGIVCQNDDGDCGWWSLDTTKLEQLYAAYFAVRAKSVRFLKGWICPGTFAKNVEEHRAQTMLNMGEQLRRYGEIEKETRDPMSRRRAGVSGRVDKDGQLSRTFTDDLAFCFCFLLWLLQKVVTREAPGLPYASVWPVHRGMKRTL